jgi:hypothetical protein
LRVNKIGFAKKTKKLEAKSARIGVYETSGAVKISMRSRKENMVAFHDFSHTAEYVRKVFLHAWKEAINKPLPRPTT